MRQVVATIFVAPPAEQQLRTFVKPIRMLLVKRLHALRINPRPAGVTKLEGEDHLYRIHEGSYRIIYAIRENGLLVPTIQEWHSHRSSPLLRKMLPQDAQKVRPARPQPMKAPEA